MLAGAARLLRIVLAGAERLFFVLANGCLLAMLALNVVNIAWRGTVDESLNFVWPWTGLLFVWMSFFGFFVVYRKGKDITVDFFVDLAGPWARRLTRVLSDLIILVLMLLLLIEAPRTLESQVGDMELIELQRYWMSVPLFASAALVGMHFLLDLIDAALGIAEPRKHIDVPE
ncbi:MAG: TRAP transporter small permease subunit [Burkholderiales bacterium]|nr:MAG: TRAP transporter small permease subunit [Burkholderiales bacterium]